MLAERRDLMVATYSSVRGTGERSTVSTLTGSGCAAGGFASVFAHPVVNKSAPGSTRRNTMITDFVSLFMGLIRNTVNDKDAPDDYEDSEAAWFKGAESWTGSQKPSPIGRIWN